ncbi:MAG: exonuclease SbcCD subunit D [Chloroflexi bacterium]|nr:exonuclease SbcCD subunit D [Chloroflexota bacterium]MBU1748676.1 exonuclease SbcCD subunit D [Chloroflexota bacterium]
MTRILHLADIHLGMENYGRLDPSTGLSTRAVDFLARLDELVDYARQNGVDLVLFAGDAFKTRDPNPTYQREFARRLVRLVRDGIPVFLLVGNHDLPNARGRASSIEIYDTLEIAGVVVARRPGVHPIATPAGPVRVAALPWMVRSHLLTRQEVQGMNVSDVRQEMVNRLVAMIDTLAADIEAEPDGGPAILAAHASVSGATFGSERSVMLGHDYVLPLGSLARPPFRYVALGHIHKHQALADDPPVVYAGSLERIDFGEENQPKGFVVADVTDSKTTWRFHEVAARPFVTIPVDARDAGPDPTAVVLAAIARHGEALREAVVRVNVQLAAGQEPAFREGDVRQAIQDAGAGFVAAVNREVDRPVRVRFGGRFAESMTPRQALEAYLEARQTPPARREVLLRYADELMETGDR